MSDDRIEVSRETLRAELTSLKLDLIQMLASKAEVDRLSERVSAIELHGSPSLVGVTQKVGEIDKRLLTVELGDARAGGLSDWMWKIAPLLISCAAVVAVFYH